MSEKPPAHAPAPSERCACPGPSTTEPPIINNYGGVRTVLCGQCGHYEHTGPCGRVQSTMPVPDKPPAPAPAPSGVLTPKSEGEHLVSRAAKTAIGTACCSSCGTHLDKHDYAFFRIGRLRSEIELAIRLLNQNVSPARVIRELEQVLMDTMSDYRPSKR